MKPKTAHIVIGFTNQGIGLRATDASMLIEFTESMKVERSCYMDRADALRLYAALGEVLSVPAWTFFRHAIRNRSSKP